MSKRLVDMYREMEDENARLCAEILRLKQEKAQAQAREFHRLTTDDSKNEPPDFTVDDGMDV